MDLKLTGKTAFISGSTAGIGFATATKLAKEKAGTGFRVFVLLFLADEDRIRYPQPE